MTVQGTPELHLCIKATKTPAKTVSVNICRAQELSPKLRTNRGKVFEERRYCTPLRESMAFLVACTPSSILQISGGQENSRQYSWYRFLVQGNNMDVIFKELQLYIFDVSDSSLNDQHEGLVVHLSQRIPTARVAFQ